MKNHSLPKKFNEFHYEDVVFKKYYFDLILLRNTIKKSVDGFFLNKIKAVNVDLFMMTNSISSPSGSGSDSLPIEFKFGKQYTFLTDSAQFGFEPIILSGLKKLYCYLPSLRGEDADARHLNQFYHCEYECLGTLNKIIPVVEGLIAAITKDLLTEKKIISRLSRDSKQSLKLLSKLLKGNKFKRITFDEAINLLEKNNFKNLINYASNGRDITPKGEIVLAKLLNTNLPFWITHFDRDRVPFYQKPQASNPNKVLNADLICPPIIDNAFGGEVAGAGQRQDKADEILNSLKRQRVSLKDYQWYVDLRNMPNYNTTAGFGLGIERFIGWILGLKDIKYSTIYPRIKNLKITP